MDKDTTVRLNRQLVILMKHLAINHNKTLKELLEEMILAFVKEEFETIKKKEPLLYAVITAEEVEPTKEEAAEIEEERNYREKEKTYSLDAIRREFGL